jgi:hypothetical protein
VAKGKNNRSKRGKNSYMRPTSAHTARCNTPHAEADNKFFYKRGYGEGSRPSSARSEWCHV